MATLNKVFLIGRLTRDPELRYTAGGTAVADLNLAVSQKFTSKSGEQKDNVVFVNITVWAKQAEACSEYLFKGSSLFVEGRLQLDMWESKEGQRRSRLRVVAQRVQFLGRPKGDKAVVPATAGTSAAGAGISEELPEEEFPVGEEGKVVSSSNTTEEEVPF